MKVPYLPFTIYCLSLLVFVAVLEYLGGNTLRLKNESAQVQESRNLLEQVTLSTYTVDGKLNYQLRSPKLWHFSDSGDMRFATVNFDYYPQSAAGISISAAKGTASKKDQEIYLDGDVVLRRVTESGGEEQTLTTRDVTISLDDKIAYTDQPATMIHGKHKTQGVGMVADLNKGEIRLKSQTRGHYEP